MQLVGGELKVCMGTLISEWQALHSNSMAFMSLASMLVVDLIVIALHLFGFLLLLLGIQLLFDLRVWHFQQFTHGAVKIIEF